MSEKKFFVGQKVRVYDTEGNEWIKTVEKITPTGRVKVENTYYVNGIEFTSNSWHRKYIEPATDEIIKRFYQEKFAKKVMVALHHLDSITYEDAVKVNNILHVVKKSVQSEE